MLDLICTCPKEPTAVFPCRACVVEEALRQLTMQAERASCDLAREFVTQPVTIRLPWHTLELRATYRAPTLLEDEPEVAQPDDPPVPKSPLFEDDGAGLCACHHHPVIEHAPGGGGCYVCECSAVRPPDAAEPDAG